MTIDPWKPPAGWERASERRHGETIGAALRAILRAVRSQPLGVVLAVCVVPGLWHVPAELAYTAIVPDSEPLFGPGRSPQGIAMSYATAAWESVWAAGQLGAAIDALRGEPIAWRKYLRGVRLAPVLFLAGVVVSLPFDLLSFAPYEALAIDSAVVEFGGVLLVAYVAARTSLWWPLLLERHCAFWEGLTTSWRVMWGWVLKLLLLTLIVTAPALPIVVAEVVLSDTTFVLVAWLSAAFMLALAEVYTLAYPVAASSERSLPEAASP